MAVVNFAIPGNSEYISSVYTVKLLVVRVIQRALESELL